MSSVYFDLFLSRFLFPSIVLPKSKYPNQLCSLFFTRVFESHASFVLQSDYPHVYYMYAVCRIFRFWQPYKTLMIYLQCPKMYAKRCLPRCLEAFVDTCQMKRLTIACNVVINFSLLVKPMLLKCKE